MFVEAEDEEEFPILLTANQAHFFNPSRFERLLHFFLDLLFSVFVAVLVPPVCPVWFHHFVPDVGILILTLAVLTPV